MAMEPYDPCPCGSGKKFKWCCQEFYGQIADAFQQDANGQRELALKKMEQLTQQFPSNPEVWGRRAELLWDNGREEEAESTLQKALDLNPNYAFGLYLRASFRHQERETEGALLLYRKAAEACAPEASELLGEIYASIGQCELVANRPLAARAALEMAERLLPSADVVRKYLDDYFGPKSTLPQEIVREFRFRPCAPEAVPARRRAWAEALSDAGTGKLSDARRAWEELTQSDDQDAPAWYNLGLVLAWLGDNRASLDAFNRYLELETDPDSLSEAGVLTEVLRHGRGMEEECEYVEKQVTYEIVKTEPVVEGLQSRGRIVDLQQRANVIAGTILDREMPPAGENLALFELPRGAASFAIVGGLLQVAGLDGARFEEARRHVESLMGAGLAPRRSSRSPAPIQHLFAYWYGLRLPSGTTEEQASRLLRAFVERCNEEDWLQRPLKALEGASPLDATGIPRLRNRLPGLVKFREIITARLPMGYDFDRLRHKLGLNPTAPSTGTDAQSIEAMNAAELAGLSPAELSDQELEKAFHACLRLDARDLAAEFGRSLAERPGGGDRFVLFTHLANAALDRGDVDEAIAHLDAGLRHDCEHNEGRRRNDYELKRAQVHLRASQPEEANDVFRRLLQRVPANLDVLGAAAEGMLQARQGPYALAFAEQGAQQAKTQGDRDRAGYFEELLTAARRL